MRLFRRKEEGDAAQIQTSEHLLLARRGKRGGRRPADAARRALADFAQRGTGDATDAADARTNSVVGTNLDGADLRDTLARADIDPEAKRRLEALLDRLEAAERAAVQTPVKRQVSWDPATIERPPVVKDESWRSLHRAPSTPTTPSNIYCWRSASTTPRIRRQLKAAAARLPLDAGAVAVACGRLRRRGAGRSSRNGAPTPRCAGPMTVAPCVWKSRTPWRSFERHV